MPGPFFAVLPRFLGCSWLGGYADYYLEQDGRRRWSVGPELGTSFFGLDAGYMGYQDRSERASGFRVRGHLTASIIGLQAGGGQLYLAEGASTFFEAGILLKYPFIPLLTSR